MEALDPGKPLSFLDHHIQCGNSLLGATPALLKRGIPDAAFEPIEGDDKAACRDYRKQNRDERSRQTTMFDLFAKSEFIRLCEHRPGPGPDRNHGRRFDRDPSRQGTGLPGVQGVDAL